MHWPDGDDLLDAFARLPGAARLLEALDPAGEAYAVGGSVRDLLLNREPQDVDVVLVSPGDPATLAQRLGARSQTHERFGTATAYPAMGDTEGPRYDLALARRERYRAPGALPEVQPAEIDEDLTRRDFTVNAIALGLSGPRRGELLAATHALDDLGARQLRVLHDASFRDDPTRLLRLARYAARLGFDPEPHTEALARAASGAGALDTVSGPRIGAELLHLAGEADPAAAFERLAALGIGVALAPGFGVQDPALARRAVTALAHGGPHGAGAGDAVLAVALLGVQEPARRPLLDRLGIDAHTRRVALAAARDAPGLATDVPLGVPPSVLLELLPVDAPVTLAVAQALAEPARAQRLARWLGEWSQTRLAIDGGDLLEAGVPSGTAVGAGLRAALGAALDGRASTREAQLATALAASRRAAGDS